MKSCYFRVVPAFVAGCLLVGVFLAVTGLGSEAKQQPESLFGLATGIGDIEDDSYNDMLYNGMVLSRAKLGIQYLVETPERVEDDVPVMESLIGRGCRVIIAGGGYHMIEPVERLSRKYPDVVFVLMDDVAASYPENVASVTFRQNEGSFLAGALAAMTSETGRIAFLGAADLPVINDFLVGYKQGARYVRPGVKVNVAFIASVLQEGRNPFEASLLAESLAGKLYESDNDIIFAVAAGSNRGVFRAARDYQSFAIGVDSDQDHMAKGYILTSMLKRLDRAIVRMVQKILDGTLENRNYSLGLKEDGVGLSPMTYTRMLVSPEVQQRIDILRRAIEAGEIDVDTTMPQAQ